MYVKRMVWLLLSFTFIIGVAACNGSDTAGSDENGSEANQSSDEAITLQFWGGVPAEAGPQDLVDAWNEENPDVQVEYTRFVNDDDGNLRLNTALQTGQEVDLFMSYSAAQLEDRVNSNFVLDLAEYDDYDIEAKMGERVELWKMNDTYYGVPTKQNANMIFLNQDALDEAGLPLPEEWTWQEMKEYAEQLTTDSRYGYAIWNGEIGPIMTSALIDDGWVNDDGTSNIDHPNMREALQLNYDMMHEDHSMPEMGEQIATGMATDQMFLNGEIAMLSTHEGLLRMSNDLEEYDRDFVISFAPFPNFEGYSQQGHQLGDTISIAADTEYPDEAWEFVKWYADEGMIHQSPGGRIPSSKDAPIDEAIELMVAGVEDTYDVDSLERQFLMTEDVPEVLPLQVSDAFKEEYERFFLGDQNLDETIGNMVERHNQYLDQN